LNEGGTQSTQERREAYLAAALELRKMSFHAHSAEMQQGFMHLAVLYEELAEYAVKRVGRGPTDDTEARPDCAARSSVSARPGGNHGAGDPRG
jgi:hypothetical protein